MGLVEFKKKKLEELRKGEDIDTIILSLIEQQILHSDNISIPPFLIKQEYEKLLGLPYKQKLPIVLQILGYNPQKLLEV